MLSPKVVLACILLVLPIARDDALIPDVKEIKVPDCRIWGLCVFGVRLLGSGTSAVFAISNLIRSTGSGLRVPKPENPKLSPSLAWGSDFHGFAASRSVEAVPQSNSWT